MSQKSSFPTFLGIGAQKAGTSWLHECLKQHPELWLPPEKELHYFDRKPYYPSPNFLHPDQPALRFIGRDPWNEVFRNRVRDVLKANYKNKDVFNWYLKYFLMPASDSWYASLFDQANGKVAGEITPSYAILDWRDVEHIAELMPKLKVIFILRHPVERAWSGFRHNVKQKWIDPKMGFDEFKNWVTGAEQSLRSDYQRTLQIWSAAFPQEQILVGFYDHISSEPEAFLTRVLDFIGVDSSPATVDGILKRERVNVSPEIDIPPQFKNYLEAKYADDIERLVDRFGSTIEHWRVKERVS